MSELLMNKLISKNSYSIEILRWAIKIPIWPETATLIGSDLSTEGPTFITPLNAIISVVSTNPDQ